MVQVPFHTHQYAIPTASVEDMEDLSSSGVVVTPANLGNSATKNIASQAEAEAGINAEKVMTPLTTKQALIALAGTTFASAAQGNKADTSLQPTDIGGDIGKILALSPFPSDNSIASVFIDNKVILQKEVISALDGWDWQFRRDETGLDPSSGTSGFVNATVNVITTTTTNSNAWGALIQLFDNSNGGENVAIYAQAYKTGSASIWGVCVETVGMVGSSGAQVGIEDAITNNGPDSSGIRVALDVILKRHDLNQTLPDFGYGVRVGAPWAGDINGVNSARIMNPFRVNANWTETAFRADHLAGMGTSLGSKVGMLLYNVPDGQPQRFEAHFSKTAAGTEWEKTSIFFDHIVGGSTLINRLQFGGDGSMEMDAGSAKLRLLTDATLDVTDANGFSRLKVDASGTFEVKAPSGGSVFKAIAGGGIVIPGLSANPADTTSYQAFYIQSVNQLRIRQNNGTFAVFQADAII